MKTLLLTSSGKFITGPGLDIFGRPLNKMKMAYIPTASKGVDELTYLVEQQRRFEQAGFDYEEIDIEGKNGNELRDILKDKEVVYVTGGNTFYLLKCVKELSLIHI